MVAGTALGVGCAWVRARGFGADHAPRWLQAVVGGYVELIRNTPFIVQLFFIFFGLPAAGFKLSAETASFIAMVINLGAYATEIIRAGLEATPKGQIEAAVSLALNRLQTFTYVVLPPALKKIWPSLISQVVIVMLGSSVCGQISTKELSYAADLMRRISDGDLSGEVRTRPGDNGSLLLTGPLGTTAARLQWAPGVATLVADGETRQFDSLAALAQQATGAELPVRALFDWLNGQATEVPGWTVDLSRLEQGRLQAARAEGVLPAVDLRIVLQR